MRYVILVLFMLVLRPYIYGQETMEGKVTYITSQHVYVKFPAMENISEGDTLFIMQGTKEIPGLEVKNLSSISCVCIPLVSGVFKVSDPVYAQLKDNKPSKSVQQNLPPDTSLMAEIPQSDSIRTDSVNKVKLKQDISGRISVSSYSNFYKEPASRNQRLRYTFSLRANNLGNSKLSAETYMSFAHSSTNWEKIKENIFNGLKI